LLKTPSSSHDDLSAKNQDAKRILVLGFGNPGRRDDGLGPALAEAIDAKRIPGVAVDSDYQLTVDDAAEAARHDIVIFADASLNGPEPFSFAPLREADEAVGFSTHSVNPAAVLHLAKSCFRAQPQAYLLGIRGYVFGEFGEGISEGAARNLTAAVDFLEQAFRSGRLDLASP
jgi:hydrogenase maturation protease